MGSRRARIGALAFVVCFTTGAQARAGHVEQINLKQVFDADVVVNGTKRGNVDTSQATMDVDGNALITKGAAKVLNSCREDPDGLPNRGKFAKTGDHPPVKLGYSNGRNGRNARQMEVADSFEVDVPSGKYRQLHVFATTGEGDSGISVTENYGASSEPTLLTVWDWFDGAPDYGYPLVNGMDRARADGKPCFDDDGATIWGYRIDTDENTKLESVEVTRTDDSASFLNVFGITGVRARDH